MFKVNVLYPNVPGSRFDFAYYRDHHMRMVRDLMTAEGLVRLEINRGVGTASQPAPYHCIGSLYFTNADGFERSIAKHASTLRPDIPNFTDVQPIRQLSEVLE